MVNQNSLKNLRLGKPGRGRQKGSKSLSTLIGEVLEKELTTKNPITRKPEKMSMAELIALRLVTKAAGGNIMAIREIFDRREGKAVQVNEISGIDGAPIDIQHSVIDLEKLSTKELESLGALVAKHAIKDENTASNAK
jgi:hypothetical protein